MNLKKTIADAYAEGRARFGDLGLDLATFSDRIFSIVHKYLSPTASEEEILTFVKGLHGADLYLASACARYSIGGSRQGSDGDNASKAWKVFENTYKQYIWSLAHFFHRGGFIAEDLADSILAELFLPEQSGVSRIASYSGRSSLNTWLRVIVCNRAINALRGASHIASVDEAQVDIADGPSLASVELTLRARRYGPVLQDSLAIACRNLTPGQRLILLWRYEQGLQLGQIGRLLGIHQSNVTRQIERMQRDLRTKVISVLSVKHGLSHSAIQECLNDLVENPIHSFSLLDAIRNTQGPAES